MSECRYTAGHSAGAPPHKDTRASSHCHVRRFAKRRARGRGRGRASAAPPCHGSGASGAPPCHGVRSVCISSGEFASAAANSRDFSLFHGEKPRDSRKCILLEFSRSKAGERRKELKAREGGRERTRLERQSDTHRPRPTQSVPAYREWERDTHTQTQRVPAYTATSWPASGLIYSVNAA